ncbi:hypothetical protein KKG51_05275, partial [Patescibacteria group bacterium]|nr:hypothetical protein [Patescibacteria group bacterium]
SLLVPFVLIMIIVDYILIVKKDLIFKSNKLEEYRLLLSLAITFVIGLIFIAIYKGHLFDYISSIISGLLHPFGIGRVGLTVAENKQPDLNEWIGQVGKTLFWLFYAGMVFVGINISKNFQRIKERILFSGAWIILISGILFSRISTSSIMNGENFLSRFIYFGSILLFIIYSFWLFFKKEITIDYQEAIIFAWLIFMLISGRGAVRLFFMITPFVCFMASYSIFNLYEYTKKSKEELTKIILFILCGLMILLLLNASINLINSSKYQAKSTGPSANAQWQKAMFWVRENTLEGTIFVHWWDYGYWVQYLGERPTVTDGGHAISYWDHLIGRYLLTTPYPETALSFMKTHNVSYLLIDPTDLGKYGAYSGIGSGPEGNDRLSWILTILSDQNQIRETQNSTIRIYKGGIPLDEDITYTRDNETTFLPEGKAVLGGVIMEMSSKKEMISFTQPEGVFIYNGKQIYLPIKYIYYEGKIIEFENGVESILRIIPKLDVVGQNLQKDDLGGIIYLSPRVSKSLFAQLYLMDDPFKKYPTLKEAHSEPDSFVEYVRSQGFNTEDFIYYQGFRGPIKIWSVNYPEGIIIKEEFLRVSGEWGEFDNLTFVK